MSAEPAPATESAEVPQDSYWEIRFGITLAVFAAILAVNDLGGGKYGDDEIKETNEKASAYMWYQAKGIKETLLEGQRDLISSLIKGGAIAPDRATDLSEVVTKLNKDINRYKGEKNEILLGSAKVGKDHWAQVIDGNLGQVVGAKEHEDALTRLAAAGDVFDYATLCLQLCLVLGAIGLLLKIPRGRKLTFVTVLVLGITGTVLCARAYAIMLL